MTSPSQDGDVTAGEAPKVSVIMPVYNVERYVGRAIESILAQTLGDFEFLVVDDGSQDSSGRICDSYAERDARVSVFHRPNCGAPAARNFAMDHARGTYLYFLDSDDWAEPSMLEDMYRLGVENDLQLVVAGFYIDTYGSRGEQDCLREKHAVGSVVFEDRRAFREGAYAMFDTNLLYPPWNKLYRRDYVEANGLRFPQTFWDDFPFVLSVIRDVERVGVTESAYYHFIRARADSETARYRRGMYEKREDEHRWMLDLYEHWGVSDERSMEVVYRRYAERLVGCIENACNPASGDTRRQMRRMVASMISTPQAKLAVSRTVPRSTMMRVMLWPIRGQHPWVAYKEGRLISFVKRHFGLLFARLKASR
jgi:glycosyltransferase involved in cell wall biosynthesis